MFDMVISADDETCRQGNVHLYVDHTVFVTSPRQGVGNGVNFRRKFLEFPILLRAERPDDVTETTKNLESQIAEFQNFRKIFISK